MGRSDRERIVAALRRLPTEGDIRHLQGSDGYRLRVGDWRVLFRRDATLRLVTVSNIRPRGSAYQP